MDNIRETGLQLDPKFDANGLISAIVTDNADGHVLMLGHMNQQALEKTLETGSVYFFSRSRQTLWQKGESSGNILHVEDIFIDCDQDALWIKARPAGPTCHTGQRSCFYRRVTKNGLEKL